MSMYPGFVNATAVDTGKTVRIPAHYLTNPVLSKQYKPLEAGNPDAQPTPEWTAKDLTAYATAHDIDLTALGAKPKKADLYAAITTALANQDEEPTSPDDVESPAVLNTTITDTPAAGDKE